MKHKVDIGGDNKFHGLKKDMYEPGERVEFYVMTGTDLSYRVTSPQTRIDCDSCSSGGRSSFSFIMPDCDVRVDISSYGSMTALNGPRPGAPVSPSGAMGKAARKIASGVKAPAAPVSAPVAAPEDGMKLCPECGASIGDSLKFCPECGCRQ